MNDSFKEKTWNPGYNLSACSKMFFSSLKSTEKCVEQPGQEQCQDTAGISTPERWVLILCKRNAKRLLSQYITKLNTYFILLPTLLYCTNNIYIEAREIYNNNYPISTEHTDFNLNTTSINILIIFRKSLLAGHTFAINKVLENEGIIVKVAGKYDLDPDLIKSIIMEEMYHADLIEQHPSLEESIPEQLIRTRGIMQTTINSDKPYHKKINSEEASSNHASIEAGAFLLKNEINRLLNEGEELNVALIASRYNNHYASEITQYGRRVENHYICKPWNISQGQNNL